MPAPDGKTVFVEIGTLYGPPNVVAESRFVAVFDVTDPYRPLQLPSMQWAPATIPENTR